MKFFKKSYDGGPDSGVTGYWLVEIKPLFSVVLLKFNKGTRDAYHSHAFNAVTIWLKGVVREHQLFSPLKPRTWGSWDVKYTPRDHIHMVEALTDTWALSFRGPWAKTWFEYKDGKIYELTHGRVVVRTFE